MAGRGLRGRRETALAGINEIERRALLGPPRREDGVGSHHSGGHIGPASSSGFAAPPLRFGRFAMTTLGRCGFLHPRSLPIKAGLMAVFAQQRPWKAQSLSRADRSSLASEASDPRSGLGLDGEHGSGSRSVERQRRGATSHDL